MEFCPIVACSFVGIVMFIGSVANLLEAASVAVMVGGLLSLAVSAFFLFKKRDFTKRDAISLSVWTIAVIAMFILTFDKLLTNCDDFSHWGAVIQVMLDNGRLPNESDIMITHNSYPVACSVFNYYISKFCGGTEGGMLWGQSILIVSALNTLTVYFNKRNIALSGVFVLFIYSILTSNVTIYFLMVDTVMPLIGLAVVVIYSFYFEDDINKGIAISSVVLFFLMQVKSSSIFFILVAWIYFVYHMGKKMTLKKWAIFGVADIAIPLISNLIWKIHVESTFGSSTVGRHAVSMEYFKSVSGQKSSEDITTIITKMLKAFPTSIATSMILFVLILFIVAFYDDSEKKQSNKGTIIALISVVAVYLAYNVSMAFVYIYSMPYDEAMGLAAYDRYLLSVYVFVYGLVILYLLKRFDVCPKDIAIVLAVLGLVVAAIPHFLHYVGQPEEIRYEFHEVYEDNDISRSGKYLILTDRSRNILYWTARYELWSDNIEILTSEMLDDFSESNDFDYIIVYTPNEKFNEFLESHGIDTLEVQDPYVIEMS